MHYQCKCTLIVLRQCSVLRCSCFGGKWSVVGKKCTRLLSETIKRLISRQNPQPYGQLWCDNMTMWLLQHDWRDGSKFTRSAEQVARRSHRSHVSPDHSSGRILPQRNRHRVRRQHAFQTHHQQRVRITRMSAGRHQRVRRQHAFQTHHQQRVRITRMSAGRHQVSLLRTVRHQSSTSRSAAQLRCTRRIFRSARDRVCSEHCRHSVQWGL